MRLAPEPLTSTSHAREGDTIVETDRQRRHATGGEAPFQPVLDCLLMTADMNVLPRHA